MKKQTGFNLIELMIVVAVIGIIVGVAYPAYQEQVSKSRRADCAGALTSLGSSMERFFTVNNTYLGAGAGGGNTGAPTIFSTTCPVDGGETNYNLTIQAATASTYTVQATPVGRQTSDKCGTLTLANTGLKGVSGAKAGVTWQDCW